jgi:Putative transposase
VGRYTHRVAISNNRLVAIEDEQISFRWKDYRHNHRQKTMTLSAEEFIRRFLIHVLPDGFQRIRYYGFLANRYRQDKLAQCRQLLGMPAVDPKPESGDLAIDYDYERLYEKLTGSCLRQCPSCRQGRMITVEVLAPTTPSFVDTS